jgi:signal peptidase I
MNKSSYEQELARTGSLTYVTTGRSMRPFLRSGEDLVHLKAKQPGQRFCKYDVILYRRVSGRYVLHRIVKVLPESYVLCGDNLTEKEPGITDEQVLAVLTGITRNGRPVDIRSRGYRFLIWLWYAIFGPRVLVMKILYRLKPHRPEGGSQ